MTTTKIKIIGFTGSLRQQSYNMAGLRAAADLLPEGVVMEIAELGSLPFFNEDLEAAGVPSVVVDFRKKIADADALLIATPEYNYSIPPVLKNALDWASRDPKRVLKGKPLAIMSASPSIFGGSRVQYHLRQVCVRLDLQTLNSPEVFITKADSKFDQDGKLVDEYTKKAIAKLVQALVDKTLQIKN